jgi:hypothetical protein
MDPSEREGWTARADGGWSARPEELGERLGKNTYKVGRTVVKQGPNVRPEEGHAMEFVRSNTHIPVPRPYYSYVRFDGQRGIGMKYIDGVCLEDVWHSFNDEHKEKIISQLRVYVEELRNLKRKQIASVIGTAVKIPVFKKPNKVYGPYDYEHGLNRTTADEVLEGGKGFWPVMVANTVMDLDGHEIVMTHGNLCLRNILVKGLDIVAVLGWKYAGFFPEY